MNNKKYCGDEMAEILEAEKLGCYQEEEVITITYACTTIYTIVCCSQRLRRKHFVFWGNNEGQKIAT